MQKENAVKVIIGRVKPDVKITCHAKLVSASHLVSNSKSGEILNRVQDDNVIMIKEQII